MYYVVGGRYTDTRFRELFEGTEERYGPFQTYEQAFAEWRGRMFQMIDDSHFRLFITQDPNAVRTNSARASAG